MSHQIPITQMEILRDNSTVFAKELPLNPFYKNLTTDIIFANNSLKASKPDNIEAFFKDYICEKSQEKIDHENEDSYDGSEEDYYDGEGEFYGENPESFLPSSDYTSQYPSSKASKPIKSTTSLQELLEARLKQKVQFSSNKQNSVEKKIINQHSETQYYNFPKKYNNYKYVKFSVDIQKNNEEMSTIERKRQMILKNQKGFDDSVKQVKTLNTEFYDDLTQTSIQKTFKEKAFKSQQNCFLLPAEKRKIILKHLNELKSLEKSSQISMQRWVSPFNKQLKVLAEISENKKLILQHKHGFQNIFTYSKNNSKFVKGSKSLRNNVNFNDGLIILPPPEITTKGFHNQGVIDYCSPERKSNIKRNGGELPHLNSNMKEKKTLDYKSLYEEFKILRNLSKTDTKTLEITLRNSKVKDFSNKNNSEEIKMTIFLNFYQKIFKRKQWFLIQKILNAFSINSGEKSFSLEFMNFVNFHRILISRVGTIDEEINFLIKILFGVENEMNSQRILETIDLIFNCSDFALKFRKQLTNKICQSLQIKGETMISRKSMETFLRKENDILGFLMQTLLLKSD